jgi:hypothetical protein
MNTELKTTTPATMSSNSTKSEALIVRVEGSNDNAQSEMTAAPLKMKMNYGSGENVKDAFATTSLNHLFALENQTPDLANLTRTQKASEKDMIEFANEFVQSGKAELNKVYYIVINKPVSNSRSKPFRVENIVAEERRKYGLRYELLDGNTIVDEKDNKFDAIQAAKEYTSTNSVSVNIRPVKKVINGDDTTAIVHFTPSKNTRKGSYLFFTMK